MSITPLIVERSPSYNANTGGTVAARGTTDGALYTAPYTLRQLLGGKLFSATVGAVIAPATFQVAADADRPAMIVRAAAGKAIIPVRLGVTFRSATLTPTVEMWTATAGLTGGTSTAVTPVNLNQASSDTSTSTVTSLHSDNMTAAPTVAQMVFQWTGITSNITGAIYTKWDWAEGNAPYVYSPVGASAALVHGLVIHCWGGTAATGWIDLTWLEVNGSDIPGA